MDKDRITGAAKRTTGAARESVSRLIHDIKIEATGAAGGAKDTARGGGHGSGP